MELPDTGSWAPSTIMTRAVLQVGTLRVNTDVRHMAVQLLTQVAKGLAMRNMLTTLPPGLDVPNSDIQVHPSPVRLATRRSCALFPRP